MPFFFATNCNNKVLLMFDSVSVLFGGREYADAAETRNSDPLRPTRNSSLPAGGCAGLAHLRLAQECPLGNSRHAGTDRQGDRSSSVQQGAHVRRLAA